MNLDTPTLIALAVGLLVVVGLVAWLMSRSRRHNGAEHPVRKHAHPDEIASVHEKNDLIASRLDRYDRTHNELTERLTRLQADYDSRGRVVESLERSLKELQEQIYELREEHKVLLQREDRHERVMHDLQARVGVSTDGHSR